MESLARASVLPFFLLFLFCIIRGPVGRENRLQKARGVPKLLSMLKTKSQEVAQETVAWTGYARVYERTVVYSDGRKNATFDVWGRTWRDETFGVVIIIPFVRSSRTFTLVKEFCVAHNRFVYSFPAGQIERKHKSILEAAKMEFAEEAHMKCARPLKPLLTGDIGAPQDKFQREAVHYYLCQDSKTVLDAPVRDAEENIDIISGVRPAELLAIVKAGTMQSNMIAAAMLALHDLRMTRLL